MSEFSSPKDRGNAEPDAALKRERELIQLETKLTDLLVFETPLKEIMRSVKTQVRQSPNITEADPRREALKSWQKLESFYKNELNTILENQKRGLEFFEDTPEEQQIGKRVGLTAAADSLRTAHAELVELVVNLNKAGYSPSSVLRRN